MTGRTSGVVIVPAGRGEPSIDPAPTKRGGTESREFEQDDVGHHAKLLGRPPR
jgi:hypothetical protein